MSKIVLKAENISKQYRLGQLGTGTISHDLNRFFAKIRGKEDPYLKIGDTNDRSKVGGSDYVWSLKDINFEVNQGEVLGIIGKNGAGKSTLLKILSQVTTPTTGIVRAKGRIASLLEVGTGFHPDLSGRENVFLNGAILGMTKSEIKNKLDEIVDFSGIGKYLDTPVKRYSSGMMVRLGFAVAAHLEPEILIVDEVLAVGDAEFQKKCLGKMKDVSGQGRTVLFVSHNMNVINSLCTRGILLENGMIKHNGNMSEVVAKYLDTGIEGIVSNAKYEIDEIKKFQVLEVSLLNNEDKHILNCIDVKDSFKIKTRYLFREAMSSVHLTVYFTNEKGEIVYFIDRTDFADSYFSAEVGEYTTTLCFDAPLLLPGRYSVTIGLGDTYSSNNDHKFDILFFEINNVSAFRTQREGSIFKPVVWNMDKI